MFPQHHQTFPVAIGAGAVPPPSSTPIIASQSFPGANAGAAVASPVLLPHGQHHYSAAGVTPSYNHPVVFDRGSASLQAGHPAYSANTGPTIYNAQAHPLLSNARDPRSDSPLSAVDGLEEEAEDPTAAHTAQEEAIEKALAAKPAKKATPAATSSVKKQQREDSSGAPAEPQRETYGIVDEEATSLWDLADGPDGYTGKPPYPYLTRELFLLSMSVADAKAFPLPVIRIALLSSEHKRLTLQELYDALEARYP